MPKQKTHKGVAKRVKVTGGGRVKRHKSGKRHLLANKSAKRKRGLRKETMLDNAMGKNFLVLLGKS